MEKLKAVFVVMGVMGEGISVLGYADQNGGLSVSGPEGLKNTRSHKQDMYIYRVHIGS